MDHLYDLTDVTVMRHAPAPLVQLTRQWVFAAFASLYGCVLVTTSAAKLLEDHEPEARIQVTKILLLISF